MNQLDQSIFQFLLFTPMIQNIFPRHRSYSFFCVEPQRHLPQRQAQDDIKSPPAENNRRLAPAFGTLLDFSEAPTLSYYFQLSPELQGSPCAHQS